MNSRAYTRFIANWLSGKDDGVRGLGTSPHIKTYLIRLRGEKCEDCGWARLNLYTDKIPIQLEHMDGNYRNNHISNLKLLCPSCHSLTPTYAGANRGNGRQALTKRR